MTIKLSKTEKIRVLNTRDVVPVMQQIRKRENKIDRNKEHLWMVCLDIDNRILMVELINMGSLRQTIADPLPVFSFTLQKEAVKLILVHNHRDDSLVPSQADYELASKMMSVGAFVLVPVIEYLIISTSDYFSFLDSGLHVKINKEKVDLTSNTPEKTKVELKALKIQVEIGKKKAKDAVLEAVSKREYQIVKNLHKQGLSIKQIVNATNLIENEVRVILKG
jgi:DNA repair protein RadC